MEPKSNYHRVDGQKVQPEVVYTTSTSYTPDVTDPKVMAVDQAIELYRDKAATNLNEFNKSFMELVNKIHEFYGRKEELS